MHEDVKRKTWARKHRVLLVLSVVHDMDVRAHLGENDPVRRGNRGLGMRRRHALVLAAAGALVTLPAAGAGADGSTDAYLDGTPSSRAPSIDGVAAVGQTLTAVFDGVVSGSGMAVNGKGAPYIWYRCDPAGTSCAVTQASREPTYVVQAADAGYTLRVSVSALEGGGTHLSVSAHTPLVTGAGSAAPAPTPPTPPAPSGGSAHGAVLSVVAFSTSPHARAGRRFAARLWIGAVAGDAAVTLRCTARLAGRALAAKHAFRNGLAACGWRLPAHAAGKELRGTMRVEVGGHAVQRSFSLRVRAS